MKRLLTQSLVLALITAPNLVHAKGTGDIGSGGSNRRIELVVTDDDSVSAPLIGGLSKVESADKALSVSILNVYRGGAAGVDGIIVSIMDQGPSQGDFPNVKTFDLGMRFTTTPKNVELKKSADKKYTLSFVAGNVELDENNDFKYSEEKTTLFITLDKDGSTIKVEEQL